jgi:hypothetical protein
VVLRELGSDSTLDTSSNLALKWTKAGAQDSNRWRAQGKQQVDEGSSAVDGRNMFYLLETTIHFVNASSFYFDQELLYIICNMKAISITCETTIL